MRFRIPRDRACLAALLAVGLALRVVAAGNRPSMGLDEARLALNIASRSYRALLSPLAQDQSAPLLFLWAEKLATQAFGVSDIALRLVPLVAGVGTLLLAFPISRRIVGRTGAFLVVAIVACSPVLVYYANAVKQYGVEIFATLLLLGLGLQWIDAPRSPRKPWPLLVAGALAVWVSAPAVFVLAAIGLGLGWSAMQRRDRTIFQFLAPAAPLWLASFGAAYALVYRPASYNPYLRHYWAPVFLTPGHLVAQVWAVAQDAIWGILVGYPGTPGWSRAEALVAAVAVVACGGVIWGLRYVARTHGATVAIFLFGPLAAAAGASLVGLYPLVFRLMLFATPLIPLLFVAGIQDLLDTAGPPVRRWLWPGLSLVLLSPLLVVSLLEVTSSNPPEHVRALVDDLAAKRRPGEPVYVFAGSIPPWAFYSTHWSAPDRVRLDFLTRIAQAGGPAFENAPSRAHRVVDEGTGLVYETAAGLELYGISTGIEWRPIGGVTKRVPDAGWAENEARRIEAAAAPSIWVVMSHVVGGEVALLRELERRGARRTYVREGNDSYLVRYVFP